MISRAMYCEFVGPTKMNNSKQNERDNDKHEVQLVDEIFALYLSLLKLNCQPLNSQKIKQPSTIEDNTPLSLKN